MTESLLILVVVGLAAVAGLSVGLVVLLRWRALRRRERGKDREELICRSLAQIGPGESLLQTLLRNLGEAAEARGAGVFRVPRAEGYPVRCLARWGETTESCRRRFALSSALRERLSRGEVVALPTVEAVKKAEPPAAPEDESEVCLGMGLVDTAGNLKGLLTVSFGEAVAETSWVHRALKIVADRSAAELERQEMEGAMKREVRHRKEVEKDLRASHRHLRDLAFHLQSFQEEERGRIAAQIHDELGQALTAMKMDLVWIRDRTPKEDSEMRARITGTVEIMDQTVRTVRHIATELRPRLLDELGLVAAIEWQAQDFQERGGLECTCICRLDDKTIHPDLATALFRCFQELMTNILRHAEATQVEVLLAKEDGNLVLRVADNGKGFAQRAMTSEKSFGLLQIQERAHFWAGEVRIEDGELGGAVVKVMIPLTANS